MFPKWQLICCIVMAICAICLASTTSKQTSTATQRQTGAAGALTGSGILGALGSMVPGVVSNMLPLVLLFGLGALMVPALGKSK